MFQYYLKLSLLSIKRTPILTSLMILAIGLGISVSTTVLTVDYLMSQDPIPSKSRQLFHVQLDTYNEGSQNRTQDGLPYQMTYQDVMNLNQSSIPSHKNRSYLAGGTVIPDKAGINPFLQEVRLTDSDFFTMFNVPFLYGSSWQSSIDDKAKKVAVITKTLNDRLFEGVDSIGKSINIDKQLYTIVGVMDTWDLTPRFYDVNNGAFNSGENIFIPFSLTPTLKKYSWGNTSSWNPEPITSYDGLLRSEAMWLQYWVQLDDRQKQNEYRDFLANYIAEQKSFDRFEKAEASGDIKNVLQWMDYNQVVSDDNSMLIGLAFMFLAVCMINTIGLLLAKFLRRAPEVGVRRALGASKKQIFIQHLVDVGLIGFAGGILGLLFAQLGLLGVSTLYSNYEHLVHMDSTLVFASVFIAIGSSIISGMYPAWLICRTNPSIYLKVQ